MEPSTKKRKLAPKVNHIPADPTPVQPSQHPSELHHHILQPQEPPPERHDFETYARHLQDAAMLIQRQTERPSPSYKEVSVLLLRWEDDDSVEQDLIALSRVFESRYHYRTQRWLIPTVANPSIKLGVQMAQFLDHARPDHLLIIYYAGHGYVGSDSHLYWASKPGPDAARLKWDGVRCLFEDAQADILFLLDTCAIPDSPSSGSNGLKQAIAAGVPGKDKRSDTDSSFTVNLVEALQKMSTGRQFSAQRLFEEVKFLQQQRQSHSSRFVNGSGGTHLPKPQQLPVFFTVTPGKSQGLTLSPVSVSGREQLPPPGESDQSPVRGLEERLIDPVAAADIRFDEHRILACTTFVGDASPDMSFFHQWLQNTPPLGAKIAVEGMFLGPPTMLLISMPHSVWNIVQHDKVCCFLGYISSHNMLHLYEKLIGPTPAKPSMNEADGGRILLEAKEYPPRPPVQSQEHERHEHERREHERREHERREHERREHERREHERREQTVHATPPSASRNTPASKYRSRESLTPGQFPSGPGATPTKPKDENEGSAEMREAAEQLKALSHMRHRSDDSTQGSEKRRTTLPNGTSDSRHKARGSSDDDHEGSNDSGEVRTSPQRVKVPRRAQPKHETRCHHCTHAPFRDSSSLRKHIAAAHTRPFPCAFSFAGCSSTFGSKNEWKRHITSQHLCLQYYRCSSCPKGNGEGRGNEFNRKDLFTQHLRRMHAPTQIKKPLTKSDTKIQTEWESHVKLMQEKCLVNRRHPPQKSACPNPDCLTVFEGAGSWDEWTEHVGRHMEKGEGNKAWVDKHLINWALDENIIESQGGGYRLLSGANGNSSPNGESNSTGEVKDSISIQPPTRSSTESLKPDEDSPGKEPDSAIDCMEVD
ncbi:unnamed protein product [Clonostachys byssicola]|uniref:C2H2-type domain-containing protein n=1 Tax=Clonostachys byssicola TaxID=160290 RepID=A0A9N9U6Z8_9HYPO|nr:unnamed protein product [Clonostachys byssicola]